MDTDIHIRRATLQDAAGIAHVHVTSSRASYAPLSQNWQGVALPVRTDLWSSVIAENSPIEALIVAAQADEAIIGFAHGGPGRREEALATNELYVIHVLPEHRARGVGNGLWQATCDAIRGAELHAMYLETFAELPCCRFYEKHGGTAVDRSPRLYWGVVVTELVYLWPSGHPHGTLSASPRYLTRA